MIKTQDYFREFITMLFIRKWIILLITIFFTVIGIVVALFWPPVYEAAGTIIVKSNQPLKSPESLENVPAELTELSENNLFSEMQILQSYSLISKTVESLNVQTNGPFSGKLVDNDSVRRFSNRIKGSLSTEVVPKTNVIHVRLTWDDPTHAQLVLKMLFREYLMFRSELYNPSEAQAFFQEQLRNFNDELKKREDKLVELAVKGQMAEPSEQIRSNLLILENMQKDLTDLQNEYNEDHKYNEHLRASVNTSEINYFTSVGNLDVGDLGKKLQELTLQKQDIEKLYQPDSPQVKTMDMQIASAAKSLREEVVRYIDAQASKLEGLQENIESIKVKMRALEQRNVELYRGIVMNNRINREINLLENSYSTFGKRLEEARISAQTETDKLFRVGVLTAPAASPVPVFPLKQKVIPLGLVIGLLVGCTIGFIIEFFDHTFKRPEDVATYSSLPTIYTIRKY